MGRYKYTILFSILFVWFLITRFWNLERWANMGWDQIDNAWAAIKILTLHKFPLLGMVAKQNSGIYIGSLYYYFIACFYWLTGLDPIASPIAAGVSALISFFVLYYVSTKLFGKTTGLFAVAIYSVSAFTINSDRIQWPVNFIPAISFLLFYFIYQATSGKRSALLWASMLIGISFHIHFTAIFYPILGLLVTPALPKGKQTLLFYLLGILIASLFLVPHFFYYATNNDATLAGKYGLYITDYYHGFHLRRFLQLAHDAFIEFETIFNIPYKILRPAVFFWLPAFMMLRRHKKLTYLLFIWILVPWIVFSTYKGEISNYYFSMNRFIAISTIAYVCVWLWGQKQTAVRVSLMIFWVYWAFANINAFRETSDGNLSKHRQYAKESVNVSRRIEFTEGDISSYLFYYYAWSMKHVKPYDL